MRELTTWCAISLGLSVPAMLLFIWLTGVDDGMVGIVFGFGGLVVTAPFVFKGIR
jgi:hypothetical protein